MGRVRQLYRQEDLLALMEPGPTLPQAARSAAIPLLAALLLEAAAETGTQMDAAAMSGGRDEQNRI